MNILGSNEIDQIEMARIQIVELKQMLKEYENDIMIVEIKEIEMAIDNLNMYINEQRTKIVNYAIDKILLR